MALRMNPWRWTVTAGAPMGIDYRLVSADGSMVRSLLGSEFILTIYDQSRAVIEKADSEIVRDHLGDIARMAMPVGTSERLYGRRMLAWELAQKITTAERFPRFAGVLAIINGPTVPGSATFYGEPVFDMILEHG